MRLSARIYPAALADRRAARAAEHRLRYAGALAAHQGDSDRLRRADRAAAGRYVPQKAGAAGRFVAGRGLFHQSRGDLQRRRVGAGGLRAVAASAAGDVLCHVAPLEERAVGVRLRRADQAAGADVRAHRPSGADLRNRRRARKALRDARADRRGHWADALNHRRRGAAVFAGAGARSVFVAVEPVCGHAERVQLYHRQRLQFLCAAGHELARAGRCGRVDVYFMGGLCRRLRSGRVVLYKVGRPQHCVSALRHGAFRDIRLRREDARALSLSGDRAAAGGLCGRSRRAHSRHGDHAVGLGVLKRRAGARGSVADEQPRAQRDRGRAEHRRRAHSRLDGLGYLPAPPLSQRRQAARA